MNIFAILNGVSGNLGYHKTAFTKILSAPNKFAMTIRYEIFNALKISAIGDLLLVIDLGVFPYKLHGSI